MPGNWNAINGSIELRLGLDRLHAVLVIMFNDGWNKWVEIFQDDDDEHIHKISSMDKRDTPVTVVLSPGKVYHIHPRYMMPGNDTAQKNFKPVESFGTGMGVTDVVTHRNFAVDGANGGTQKISITIVLVDDDVRPNGAVIGLQGGVISHPADPDRLVVPLREQDDTLPMLYQSVDE